MAIVIFTGIVVVLLISTIEFIEERNIFNELYTSYLTESSFVINNNSYFLQFDNFTDSFLEFSVITEPNFRLAYVYKNKEYIKIKNLLDKTIKITTPLTSFDLAANENITINSTNYVVLTLDSYDYNFTISNNELDLHVLFKSHFENDIKIYAK